MTRGRLAFFFGATALLLSIWLGVVRRAEAAEPGDDLTIYVMTMGPGDHPFFKFGHNAIWVHDGRPGVRRGDMVYNFGTFGFESPLLIVDFLKGHLKYWLSVQSLQGTLRAYEAENRTVTVQELNLSPAERVEIALSLAENAKPENKYYKYDYYGDNCSTRVRDAVDRVTGGRVRAASQAPGSMTFRQHTLRLTADDIPVYLGLHAAMGGLIDQPVRVWEEMFLPEKLQETLRSVRVPGADGVGDQPLVKSEKVLVTAKREPNRSVPPKRELPMGLAGVALGGVFAWLASRSRSSSAARIALGSLLVVVGFVFGMLGTVFVGLWAFTDHAVAFRNENILQITPWSLLLVGVGISFARGRPNATKRVYYVVLASATTSLLGLLCKALPWFDQNNWQWVALCLPFWALTAFGLSRLQRRALV